MVDMMTSLKLYTLLAVADLVGLFLTTWFGILPHPVGWNLIMLVAIPLVEMMRSFPLREIVQDLLA